MFRYALCLILVTFIGHFHQLYADETNPVAKKAWQDTELKKLAGRWTAVRAESIEPGQKRRRRLELEFEGSELTVFQLDAKGTKMLVGTPKVTSIEPNPDRDWLPLVLQFDRARFYYDLDDDNMVIVGRVLPRPWEGFRLSGEYQRTTKEGTDGRE